MLKKVTREVNVMMEFFGDADLEDRHIRINPRKGGIINTIIHENLHLKHPKMKENNIAKKAKQIESKLSIRGSIDLLNPFLNLR